MAVLTIDWKLHVAIAEKLEDLLQSLFTLKTPQSMLWKSPKRFATYSRIENSEQWLSNADYLDNQFEAKEP